MTNECPYDPASSSSLEQRIFQIWKDILNMPDGRQDATFFELQGQSISAVRIAGRIEDELGIAIDVGILFEDPNLETFTREVLSKAAGS